MIRLFFDSETSGLPKRFSAPATDLDSWSTARLVQLSWILADEREELSRGDFIIRPEGFVIPEEASRVHGITTELALEKGAELKRVVYYFLGAARVAEVMVGHNIPFDLGVVGAELIRTWGKNYLEGLKAEDTMRASVEYCAIPKANGGIGYKWPKLQELYVKCFGHEFEGAHNSMSDISATFECYWALKELNII